MCEKTIKKSETITRRDCDEWIDGEGKFHRRIIFETITSPMNLNQATFPKRQGRKGFIHPYSNWFQIRSPRNIKVPKYEEPFWSPMKPSDNEVLDGFINSKLPERPRMNFNEFMGEQKKIIDSKLPEKPAIDVKEFIEKGRKILSGMGIDVENEIKNLFTKPKYNKDLYNKYRKEGRSHEQALADSLPSESKQEEETLNQKKEVKTWKKTKKPLKKKNQKKQNQKKKK